MKFWWPLFLAMKFTFVFLNLGKIQIFIPKKKQFFSAFLINYHLSSGKLVQCWQRERSGVIIMEMRRMPIKLPTTVVSNCVFLKNIFENFEIFSTDMRECFYSSWLVLVLGKYISRSHRTRRVTFSFSTMVTSTLLTSTL